MFLHGDHEHGHSHMHEEDKAALAEYIWRQETVDLSTVGIDIGSSTSHLLFATVRLQRRAQGLSSRFVVTRRDVVWRSPIMLTPFLADGTIDAARLEAFIQNAYRQAGLKRSDVDTGAVILTGEAIKRKNARAIDELFAEEAGKFVCATAGHKLECTLAAHGSGAAKLSRELGETVLHIDIGGGTTKLALIDSGRIRGVCAFAVGGRLIGTDEQGGWTRVDESAQLAAEDLGLPTDPATLARPEVRQQIARRLAAVAVDYIRGGELDRLGMALQLTEALPAGVAPTVLTFSGGVSEYIYGREQQEYGDIAKLLATELREQLSRQVDLPVRDPGQGIRATVIGASQFTVQVSGKTIYLPDHEILPVHNVPVVHVGLDLSGEIDTAQVTEAIRAGIARMDLSPQARMAIAFEWKGAPEYRRLAALGRGIVRAVAPEGRRDAPLLLMIDGDVGGILGSLLHRELDLPGALLSVDGVQLQELDFVDVGEWLDPPGVVPVVIKSLLFS
jgi:ethanolamine utilization protein EutA